MLPLSLDYKSRMPISEQLTSGIVRMAACGALQPGEQLPSVRTMAQELGVNPNTVQKAYRTLEQMGAIYSLPGKGSFVGEGGEAQEARKRQLLQQLDTALQAVLDAGVAPEEIEAHCRDRLRHAGGVQE